VTVGDDPPTELAPKTTQSPSPAMTRITGAGGNARISGRVVTGLVAWAALVGTLTLAGWLVSRGRVDAFDRHVTTVVVAHRTAGLNALMRAVTWLGSWVAGVIAGAILVVLALRRRILVSFLVLAAAAWAGEAAGVALAKRAVARARPPRAVRLVAAHGWSWPSGHTATAVVVFGTLAMLVTVATPRAPIRAAAWTVTVVAVAAVAFSRVELGVHWTSDVIAGAVFAGLWLAVLMGVGRPARVPVLAGAPR
jgi:membrane-associated phospholipid phosphatase